MPAVTLQWQWSSLNIAAAHNGLVSEPEDRFADTIVNRSRAHSTGTTAYTSVIALANPDGLNATSSSASVIVVYDRLADGWNGPPGGGQAGEFGVSDGVYAMRIDL